jgi:uncharacterized coiled-coil protein SlyX
MNDQTRRLTTDELLIACHDINGESISIMLEYQHQIDHQEQVIQELSEEVVFLKSLPWWQRPIASFYGMAWEAKHNSMARTNRQLRKDIRILIDRVLDLEDKRDEEDLK